MTNTSRNMVEVAVLPMNLQLFAESDPVVEEPTEPTEPIDPVEPTEPAEPSEPTDPVEPDKAETPEVADPEQKPKQDSETNRKFQEMRHKLEAAERQLKDRDDWVKQNYGHQGINSWDEYQTALAEQKKREMYDAKGIDYDEIKGLLKDELENHPSVVEARRVQEQAAVQSEISDLNKQFPDLNIKEVSDLFKLPNYEQMHQKIMNGYSMADAYFITHKDEIQRKTVEAAKQSARNAQDSKDHIRANGGESDVDTFSVPAETMREYERMFAKELRTGKMTRDDFIKHYKKSIGK